MRDTLAGLIYAIRTNFWFIPTLLAVIAVIAGVLVVELDVAINRESLIPLYMSIESARLALSTIAGSMITIASLVFSMTLVALTMVSRQLGPRLLLRFMDDRPTQVVLGIFIATFLFSLIVLLRVGDDAHAGVVPGLGVLLSATLAIAALGGMFHFFDHVSKRIQADSMIGELGHDLQQAIEQFVEQSQSGNHVPTAADEAEIARCFLRNDRIMKIHQPQSGYLRRLHTVSLTSLCHDEDLILRTEIRPGQYVLEGQHVLTAASRTTPTHEWSDDIEKRLAKLMVVSGKRMPEATIEFEVDALVEVALRALSPGVNDPFTAMACIDQLSNGARLLMSIEKAQIVTRDSDETVRIIHTPEPFERLLKRSFEPVIEAADGNRMVRARIRKSIDELIALQPPKPNREALETLRDNGRVPSPA